MIRLENLYQRSRPARLPAGSWLPTPLQSLLFGLRPEASVERWRRRFGDVFTIKLLPTGPFAYVADPEAARAIFRAGGSRFHAGEANRMLAPVNGARSVVVLDEEEHRRARRLLLPLFRPAQVAAHRGLIEGAVERDIRTWPRGRPFALAPHMQEVALEVIVRATLGDDPGTLARLRKLLPALLRANTLTWLPGMGRDLGPLSPAGRLRRLTDQVNEVIYGEIGRRRTAGGGEDHTGLGQLLATGDGGRPLSDHELRDHVATLLLSGHETTSSSLSWAFERILRHPAVVERLREELHEGGGRYLEAAVKEVLRCRPAVMDTGRVLKAHCTVGGHPLPAGSQARIAIAAIQQRPDLFPDPEKFRPERFLDGEARPGDWIPFGGGSRRCLGAALAMFEIEVVVATVLRQAQLRPAGRRPERAAFRPPYLTLSPARGGRVVLERRLAPARP